MKIPLTKHYCIMKDCDYEEENHKAMDGLKCPKCQSPIMSENKKEER
ncbi:hypothetical protein [Priestia flexa]